MASAEPIAKANAARMIVRVFFIEGIFWFDLIESKHIFTLRLTDLFCKLLYCFFKMQNVIKYFIQGAP